MTEDLNTDLVSRPKPIRRGVRNGRSKGGEQDDRRKRDDTDYKGPERRAAGRAAASDNREKRVA